MTQFQVGDKVRVVASEMFASEFLNKEGIVSEIDYDGDVHLMFEGHESDYGRPRELAMVEAGYLRLVEGDRVKVVNVEGTFYHHRLNKEGVVTSLDDDGDIHIKFDDGETDYGHFTDVEKLNRFVKGADGWISNVGNEAGVRPMPRGTLMDILYNDGTIIHELPIGTGTSKRAENNDKCYSASDFGYRGTGNATIKAYRFPADRPQAGVSLDAELTKLRAELEVIQREKAAAEREVTEAEQRVTTKKAAVSAVEARRLELIQRLAKHGIQFIGEAAPEGTSATDLHIQKALRSGVKLRCVTEERNEHTVGRTYEVLRVDPSDNLRTYRLQSNDGLGYWILNSNLHKYVLA